MNIIFHHPRPLLDDPRSASGIRPVRMLEAFRAVGCDVDVVAGYGAERKKAIKRVVANVGSGCIYHFLYSESSTMPAALTERHHLPTRPHLDVALFAFCKRNNIPVGLFYRDIYWRFANYDAGLSTLKSLAAKAFYLFDLSVYQRYITRLYLPSLEMGDSVPVVDSDRFAALPPGHDGGEAGNSERGTVTQLKDDELLRLFYVGGMSSDYRMHKLFEVVFGLPQVLLTVCTREAEWQSVKLEYPSLPPNISVVHENGEQMQRRLSSCDIALLFVEPHEYREFAAPVKLYEYLGAHKPVIASERTLAGRFVTELGIGWTIPYSTSALRQLLGVLCNDPCVVDEKKQNCRQVAPQHTWRARAEQVITELAV